MKMSALSWDRRISLRVKKREVVFSDEMKRGKNFLTSDATRSIAGAKNESG
jgi:hypothetical protein